MKRNGYIAGMMAFVLILLMGSVSAVPSEAAGRKLKTRYTNHRVYGGVMAYSRRCKVTSYYLGTRYTYSKKKEMGEMVNTSSQEASRTLSLSRSFSRSVSLSASVKIPKKIMKSDVSATIGGSLTFSTTTNVSVTGRVAPRSKRSVYLQYKYAYAKYKYVIQDQRQTMKGKWVNSGKQYVRINTVRTKVPVLVL